MTRQWMTNDEDFRQLHSRTASLDRHVSLMRPDPAQVRRGRGGRKGEEGGGRGRGILSGPGQEAAPAAFFMSRTNFHLLIQPFPAELTFPWFYWHWSHLRESSLMRELRGAPTNPDRKSCFPSSPLGVSSESFGAPLFPGGGLTWSHVMNGWKWRCEEPTYISPFSAGPPVFLQQH